MNLFKSTKATTYISSRGDKVYPIIMDIKTGIVEGDAVFTTGDIDTAYLYATILEEQSDYNILGSTVICNIQRPDGTTMKVQGDVLGNNLIEFPLGQSGVSQEGIYNFDIAVVFSEKKMVTSPTAQYSVTQSIEVVGEIEEDDRFPVLESLISGINVINEEELVRVSNEEVRQSKEEAREQAESVRARNEETRLANNEAIRNEEAVRVVNENERKNAESLRVQEENKRKQQENTRIAQENTRVSQETARVNAENTRKNQEATRQANEATRVSQETNRNQAESTRNSNETVRQNQENTRKNQEQARVTAEGNRVTSENVRVSAEQARVLKEQERQAIEVERQNSESTREQQEATRVSQENARKQADILRQQEHEERQRFLDGFEGKLNTVVDDVATIKDDVVSVKEANKRQDIFLQGLYNENLDGRVTVKEEGSVISLTNSDDGLVDIIGLEGNTLVNYVADGAKELTLNGDIDVAGTSVTLTDTVDNGLVDVMCEGNTLVNLAKIVNYDNGVNRTISANTPIKPNTTYTVWCDEIEHGVNRAFLITSSVYVERTQNMNGDGLYTATVPDGKGREILTSNDLTKPTLFTTGSTEVYLHMRSGGGSVSDSNQFYYKNLVILEGDWTRKEIPPCFEGMKSVGECEDNKIEIVSQSNLADIATSGDTNFKVANVKAGRTYSIKSTRDDSSVGYNLLLQKNDGTNLQTLVGSGLNDFYVFTPSQDGILFFNSYKGGTQISDIMLVEGIYTQNTMPPFKPYTLNKKEITLSEPLRALPNGVCDKVMKIGGKWYVERSCGSVVLDGSENWRVSADKQYLTNTIHFQIQNTELTPIMKSGSLLINNQFVNHRIWTIDHEGIFCASNGNFAVSVLCSKLSTQDVEGFKSWLQANPTTIVYQLETPIYEPLEIEPTLNTYNDITHISNNSTIPCNMTVKNTGYNAIIKPSTQYTVAFDTNKSGEVGINLGGSKVTTTNNVATVTTPSTLTDDTLRLTGKGIKASKVRLLEGDKTNWIPSYFEGMKSCFEDKLQDDGTYKMEILSNNKNLLDIYNGEIETQNSNSSVIIKDGIITLITSYSYYTRVKYLVDFKIGGKYLLSSNFAFNDSLGGSMSIRDLEDKEVFRISDGKGVRTLKFTAMRSQYYIVFGVYSNNGTFAFSDITLQEDVNGKVEHTPHKHNKIQFSSIEPLRGVGDVKDKFVFKDGKLMVERNTKEITIDNNMGWVGFDINTTPNNPRSYFVLNDCLDFQERNRDGICKDFALHHSDLDIKHFKMHSFPDDNSRTVVWVYIPRANMDTVDRDGFKEYFKQNPTKLVYPIRQPIYEEVPYETQKLILEGYLNGTLFFDTNIPPTVEANYTANIPVVSELNKNSNEIGLTQEDLSVTQVAVDFLLMSNIGEEMLSSFNLNTRGRNSMGAYFANRITKGALKYEDVISKYPQYKEEIDSILGTK